MSILTEAGKIGRLKLKNRMFMAPMGTHNGNLTDVTAAYFKRRIAGGAAMVFCNMMVTDRFEDTSASMTLNENNIDNFKSICDYAHENESKVCAQLMPGCGRVGGPAPEYGVPVSASACSWLYAPTVQCHELSAEEIGILEQGFRETAERAIDAGADAIEIHAYGGYLTDQFLTACWNTRTDRYGGDLDGRMTFLLELIDIVREVGGVDYPVIVKYSAEHFMPPEYGFRGVTEGIEIARKLEAYGVAALHVDVGCYERWYYSMPPVYFQEEAPQIAVAKKVRENVTIPVITHGRLGNVAKAEAVLEDGCADFAAIGRGLLADPDLPAKVIAGRADDIRPCIGCNEGCIGKVVSMEAVGCAVNPFCAKELERRIVKAEHSKKILVIGAGPSGCAFALMAKEAGHEVEIWEKTSRVGGRAIAAASPYMKRDMMALSEYYHVQLVKKGIPILFEKEGKADAIRQYAPDVLVWAAGGRTIIPQVPGADSSKVIIAEDALRGRRAVGEKIVIIGAGLVGVESALHFDKMGHDVTLIEMAETILPKPPFAMNKMQLEELMSASGVKVMTGTRLSSVTDTGVMAASDQGEQEICADTVMMAVGIRPADTSELDNICRKIVIGEAGHGVANIMTGVEDAYLALNEI